MTMHSPADGGLKRTVSTNARTSLKEGLKESRGLVIFLLCFGFFRTAIADWNPILSGSKRPTVHEGELVLVNRLAYDFKLPLTDSAIAHLAEPQRGDIVTFLSPKEGTRLIKRVVATPGHRVELKSDVLLINDEVAVQKDQSLLREPIEHGMELDALHATERSADSRCFGFVPRHPLIGRANRALLSADTKRDGSPRFARTGPELHKRNARSARA